MPDLGRYKDLLPLDFTFFEYFGQRLSDLFFILVIWGCINVTISNIHNSSLDELLKCSSLVGLIGPVSHQRHLSTRVEFNVRLPSNDLDLHSWFLLFHLFEFIEILNWKYISILEIYPSFFNILKIIASLPRYVSLFLYEVSIPQFWTGTDVRNLVEEHQWIDPGYEAHSSGIISPGLLKNNLFQRELHILAEALDKSWACKLLCSYSFEP